LTAVNPIAAYSEAPLRAHARRNRERIIASAREVFALRGEQAYMGDIAKHAGVGNGTLYRHFPDKEALLIEVIRGRFEELCEIASRAEDIRDPVESVEAALRTALAATSIRILRRAQTAGAVRSDLSSDDIPMILTGIISTMYFRPSAADWERHLRLILAGLRPNECDRPEGEMHVRDRGVPRPA
jgi:AcrR family transcriptional regulator